MSPTTIPFPDPASTDAIALAARSPGQAALKVVPTESVKRNKAYPFMLGGCASACATMFTHPLDLTKVQMQTIKSNKLNTAQFVSAILRNHGVRGLYDGLTAAMLRALSYSTFRFGAYEFAKQKFLPSKPGMLQMVTASAAAGGMAGLLGVPAEVVLIRMASDRPRPPAERYGYKNGVQGLVRITKEEGVLALYRGVGPNVVRAILMNASQLASYDYFKRILLNVTKAKDGPALQFGASFLAGTVATTVCAPADVIKSRVMAAKSGQSIPALIAGAVKNEGFGFFFKGWTAAWVRLCPQTILTLIFLEQLRLGVDLYRGSDDA